MSLYQQLVALNSPEALAAELHELLEMIDEGYNRKSWHGPNLCGALRGVTVEQAGWRPQAERHNIWEQALHAAYWKYTVRRRLLQEKRGSFPLKGSNWFERGESNDAELWKADLKLLDEVHRSLRTAIAALDPGELRVIPAKSKVSNGMLIRGVAFHDVYHAGQIQLLKRLYEQS
jgi:hypothetical protein